MQNFCMSGYKELVESILSGLMGSVPITDPLLKLIIFASKRGDKELLEWVSHEL